MGYEVDFLPVGKGEKSGDAITLRFGNLWGQRTEQAVVVIDGGFQETGELLVDHIRQRYGTEYIDVVISTHPDSDHAGGLLVVLEELAVGELWMHRPWNHCGDIANMFRNSRVSDESVRRALRESLETARELETLARRRGVAIVEPFAGHVDTTRSLVVLSPTLAYYERLLPEFRGLPETLETLTRLLREFRERGEGGRTAREDFYRETLTDEGETSAENNSSVVVLALIDGQGLLFTGDAGIPALTGAADAMDAWGFQREWIKMVQLPHHGSDKNIGPTVLGRLLGPTRAFDVPTRVGVVSAAPDGAPDHPSKRVVNAFRRRGVAVHATQGTHKVYYSNAPVRLDFVDSVPVPFYPIVEL